MSPEIYYFLFIILYSTVPPLSLYHTLKGIYKTKETSAWHTHYLYKYLITLSFLPLLWTPVELGLRPSWEYSFYFLLLTFLLAVVLYPIARKEKVTQFYIGGVHAAFMEEILYRGIIFGLANAIGMNAWVSLVISSLLFGIWHLKNFPWQGKNKTIYQFFYTALFAGPMLCVLRILTGDLYLSIFVHFVMNTTVALSPEFLRKWKLVWGPKPVDR